MYAIIRAGGKQAKVRSGDVIEVERVKNAGDTVEFQPILVVDEDGATHSDTSDLAGAVVTAKVLGEVKGDKVDIFKYKNKTGYRRHMGHRQTFTQLEISGIQMKKAKKAAAKKSAAAKTTKSQTETAATDEGAASEEE